MSTTGQSEPSPPTVDLATQASVLQLRYIELLEQRIASLEALLPGASVSAKTSPPPPAITTALVNGDRSNSVDGTAKNEKAPGSPDVPSVPKIVDGVVKPDAETKTEGAADDEKPSKPRVRTVVNTWNESKSIWEDLESDATAKDSDSNDDKSTTTFRRIMDIDNPKKLVSEEIDIESAELQALFVSCCRRWSLWETSGSRVLELESPFVDFAWYYQELIDACEPKAEDTQKRKEAREDLQKLFALVKKSSMESYFKAREAQIASKTIKFDHLWALFPQGARVYARTFMNEWQMLEVVSFRSASDIIPPKDQKIATLTCAAFDWEGASFEPYFYVFNIEKFDNDRQIDTLEAFPVEYYKTSDGTYGDTELRQNLIERGKRFYELCMAKSSKMQCNYHGEAATDVNGLARLTSGMDADDKLSFVGSFDQRSGGITRRTVEVNGRVIVDNYTFLRSERNEIKHVCPPLGKMNPWPGRDLDCKCIVCQESPTQSWFKKDNREQRNASFAKDDKRLLLCPPKVLGYALKEKLWAQFLVKRLESMSMDTETMENKYFNDELQLEERYKKMLLAFVSNHESARKQATGGPGRETPTWDVIDSKGQGLAILLHGPPGVGKTLTAETVALATNRPLLPVSVAEIGVKATNAESQLSTIFADAQRWEAVLLIDEADVFLEERIRTDDPNRNALVSVLLRCLEYYRGIIILTTNRINTIDVAVQSRMHLAIRYKDLDLKQKKAIFINLLNKIPDKQIESRKSLYADKRFDRMCKQTGINGRQIRNIVASAQALANEESRKMTLDDLEEIFDITKEFVDSLKDKTLHTRGLNEATD